MRLNKVQRDFLRELARRGGHATAGRGAKSYWAKLSPAERSRIMRQRAVVREKRRRARQRKPGR